MKQTVKTKKKKGSVSRATAKPKLSNDGEKKTAQDPSGVKISGTKKPEIFTRSGIPIEPVYNPEHIADFNPDEKLGQPGEYPFTRGIYKNMYRGKLWTMRQYAGYGTPKETNVRYKYLLKQGQTGLSVALDLPTQLGYNSDAPQAEGEVGKVGVAICSLLDMETIFEGIPIDRISTSFTINATASILLCMYKAVADKQGVPAERISGTIQNDILKEFGSRGAWVLPVDSSMRLAVDAIEYCVKHLPRFNPISIASHYRDAGAQPAEELAYTFSAGVSYVRACLARRMNIDDFAPRLSWFFYTYVNFFEEIAKYRAGRRIWARVMKEKFGAKNPDSMKWRVACVCGGHSFTKQEPLNNIARSTIETMAVTLSGLQSVFTAAYDEAYAIPTELSAKTALRVQQIIAYETDIPATADPLAGSYFMETLTNQMEEKVLWLMEDIEKRGGFVECLKKGYIQQQIARRAYEHEMKVKKGETKIVGVNLYHNPEPACAGMADREDKDIEIYEVDPKVEQEQRESLERVRRERDSEKVKQSLSELETAARGKANMVPLIEKAVKSYATTGEIMDVLRDVFGEYQPTTVY